MPLPHCPPRLSLSNAIFPSMFGCWVPALEPPGGQRLNNYGSARGRGHWELEPYSSVSTWVSSYGQTGISIVNGVNGGLQTKTSPTANTGVQPKGFSISAFFQTNTWSGGFGRSFVGVTAGSTQYSLAVGRFASNADLSLAVANHRVIAPTGTWSDRLLHVIGGVVCRGATFQICLVVKDMISHEVVTYNTDSFAASTITGVTRAYFGNTASTTTNENVTIFGFAVFEEGFKLPQALRYIDDPWFYLRPRRVMRVGKAPTVAAADQHPIWFNQQ